jgi:hypothetical protein
MRSTLCFTLFLASALVTTGCPGSDPELDRPCEERTPRVVQIGTGEEEFEAIGAGGVSIMSGDQGGTHVWMSLRCRNLGPRVTVSYGVRDSATGESLSQEHLKQIVELEYTGETNETVGLFAFMKDERSVAPGTAVTLWARVVDQCDVPTEATVETTIN